MCVHELPLEQFENCPRLARPRAYPTLGELLHVLCRSAQPTGNLIGYKAEPPAPQTSSTSSPGMANRAHGFSRSLLRSPKASPETPRVACRPEASKAAGRSQHAKVSSGLAEDSDCWLRMQTSLNGLQMEAPGLVSKNSSAVKSPTNRSRSRGTALAAVKSGP